LAKLLFSKINGNLHSLTKLLAENALEQSGGNITVAARNIGVGRKTLERMLKKYGISRN
jgi:transcriptional regulator of acetoin/glycerol metabolism